MKILITGSKGKLGQRLCRVLSSKHEILGVDVGEVDICSLSALTDCVQQFHPVSIINAAAYTAVDRCEDEADLAYQVNAVGVRNLGIVAERIKAKLIHFSTDFVFDGERSGPPYREYDLTNPRSVYGKTKLCGEVEAFRTSPNAAVLRLSWLYGEGGWNFTDWVVSELQAGRQVRIVTDQVGCPTWVGDVVTQVERLLAEDGRGLYHCSGQGCCSRHEWACEATRQAGFDPSQVVPVTSSEFKQKAPRPAYSAMDNFFLRAQGIETMRPWQEALSDHLRNR